MNNNLPNTNKNISTNQNNQIQQINDLSRFGHSVTLCKLNLLNILFINYYFSKFK